MRVWTVHIPPEAARLARGGSAPPSGGVAGLRLPVLVPEGFSWLAFLFGVFWLLWHRLWLETVAYLALAAILTALLPGFAQAPAALALQFLLGAHAQDLRRWALARRRYALAHVVTEQDADRALARVFEARPELPHWLAPPDRSRAGARPA